MYTIILSQNIMHPRSKILKTVNTFRYMEYGFQFSIFIFNLSP